MVKAKKIRISKVKIAVLLALTEAFMFLENGVSDLFETYAGTGFGIENVCGDEIWMGWTIFESGNVGYGQAGGDGGKAYGRYQFDYRYALPDFLAYVIEEDGETYPMLEKYTGYAAGSDRLLSGAGLGSDWVKAYNTDREGFSGLQDKFAYNYYYIPAKRAMADRGIDLDEIGDPAVKGTVYSFAIRDGANDNGVRAAWQSYHAGDWYELYGIRGGSLDFSYGTSGGFYISDVVVNAQSLTIPDNGSSMPIVYMSQSGGQPWSNVPFGGGPSPLPGVR